MHIGAVPAVTISWSSRSSTIRSTSIDNVEGLTWKLGDSRGPIHHAWIITPNIPRANWTTPTSSKNCTIHLPSDLNQHFPSDHTQKVQTGGERLLVISLPTMIIYELV
jgi:hypothetical protein